MRPKLPALPPPELPDGPVLRPGLRVAVILDAFSSLALRYEWDQVEVTPQLWRQELSARPPDLLFVESAWNGNDKAWRLAMSTARGPSPELRELVTWCQDNGIPTVFWNKEDPPNYDRFIETARLFDHVFTVDAERLAAYREDLGHDRVGLLPFGAQPRIHNPVRRGLDAEHDVAFAGSYFTEKHPERREQMDYLLGAALEFDLHIYARMATGDPRYSYPEHFARRIVGTLPYERMLSASHAYKVFLNVNSVTRSPTMCARRLFELSAAQTPVVSGPAASIAPFFGDDVTVVSDRDGAALALKALLRHRELRDRIALRAHRRVFDQHLYRHRVNDVLRTVGLPEYHLDASVSAVVPTMRPQQVDHVLDFVASQAHPDVELVLVTHGFELPETELRARAADLGVDSVTVRRASRDQTLGACMNLGVQAASGRYVAKMDDDNYYAPHYLTDLLRVFEYTDAAVTGKWAHYAYLTASGASLLRFAEAEHRFVDLVQGGTILTARSTARDVAFEDLPQRVDTTFLAKVRRDGGLVYSADRFNFVSVRNASPDGHTWPITDQELLARSSQLVCYGEPREHVTV
ncbi:glycosyltransferase family protein [Ornithinicoccus halotolerans]|uniref:glycosyltransferase family protein n=1 Tax=Ornithinicoccus halotolerans TaxID=1748220 RepID=UPI001E53947E|nr:glycosyltransferase [Ornithinicoccus halotolerans]